MNSDYVPKQRQSSNLCNGNKMCFLWGRRTVFKYYLDEILLQGIDWLTDWLQWGETDWTAAIISVLFTPRVNVSGEPWRWWCRLDITPDLSTRARWQSYQQRHLERVGRKDEGMRILSIQYLWYVNGSFTCRKTLQHGTSGFTSHTKEGVLRIFISLQNLLPRPDLNPRPLGPAASTLTTTLPRRSFKELQRYSCLPRHVWKL
jgi:hypothetical protein